MITLLHADGETHLPGMALAILSLQRHDPDRELWISCPGAPAAFTAWVADHAVRVSTDAIPDVSGWDIKPHLLRRALDEGHEQVLWMDSDVIVTGPLGRLRSGDPAAVVVAEEPFYGQAQGSRVRTEGWGLTPGRDLVVTTNTCVMLVNRQHRALLDAWIGLLASDAYRDAQARPAMERPHHLVGDQDLLCALLGSREFAHIPVRFVRRGSDIAQCGAPADFAARDRLRAVRHGLPLLLHSSRVKPWQRRAAWRYQGSFLRRMRARYEDLHLDLSPYTIVARQYVLPEVPVRLGLPEPPPMARWLRLTRGARYPSLPELPLTTFDGVVRQLRIRLRIGRFRTK